MYGPDPDGPLDDQMDIRNNEQGQTIGGDCWDGCLAKWESGQLTCVVDGVLSTCPPPPDDFPRERPTRPGV